MSLAVHLLGRPAIGRGPDEVYRFRSRKSWALLAYLVLSDRPPARSLLASLLFGAAADPLRALRWSLAEIRRALGDAASVGADPIQLRLPDDALVDVFVVTRGTWTDAVALPGIGSDLLAGMAFRDAAEFETWLLSKRRRVVAATEAILHEAALASLSRGAYADAIAHAVRVVAMNPLEENHQALLIRAYRMAGDGAAADRQLAACTDLFARELGIAPGPAVRAAARSSSHRTGDGEPEAAEQASVEAVVEAGSAAVAAGALEPGLQSLRAGVALADRLAAHPLDRPGERSSASRLRSTSRLALAETLIHSLRGEDEEGSTILHEAGEIALCGGESALAARATAELGYVDFLRARYDRAEQWLTQALQLSRGREVTVKAITYLGCVYSDRAEYPAALARLGEAVALSGTAADSRRRAYALAMLGRVHLLRGELTEAAAGLDAAIEVSRHERWLAFLPWPQALRGEVALAGGDPDVALQILQQAFARACQLGDPCWEGVSARGLALVAEATGDVDRAFRVLRDARVRCNRLSDTYVWLDAYILDAQCELGRRHSHEETGHWIESLHALASGTGMRELIVRSLLHRAGGHGGRDLELARLLAAGIDNPALQRLLQIPREAGSGDADGTVGA